MEMAVLLLPLGAWTAGVRRGASNVMRDCGSAVKV